MNRNQLRYFVSAAEHRSFTKAAEQYYISQTAVTQQIQQLEQMLHGNSLPFNLSLSGPLTGPPEWIPKWTVPCPFPPR